MLSYPSPVQNRISPLPFEFVITPLFPWRACHSVAPLAGGVVGNVLLCETPIKCGVQPTGFVCLATLKPESTISPETVVRAGDKSPAAFMILFPKTKLFVTLVAPTV